jgi:hypothetical protein
MEDGMCNNVLAVLMYEGRIEMRSDHASKLRENQLQSE